MESRKRSVAKSLSWRFIATTITVSVTYFVTGELALAAEVGLLDTLIKLVTMYMHERAWLRISLGRSRAPPTARVPDLIAIRSY